MKSDSPVSWSLTHWYAGGLTNKHPAQCLGCIFLADLFLLLVFACKIYPVFQLLARTSCACILGLPNLPPIHLLFSTQATDIITKPLPSSLINAEALKWSPSLSLLSLSQNHLLHISCILPRAQVMSHHRASPGSTPACRVITAFLGVCVCMYQGLNMWMNSHVYGRDVCFTCVHRCVGMLICGSELTLGVCLIYYLLLFIEAGPCAEPRVLQFLLV